MAINKISIGRDTSKRYTHDRSMDASYTANIGFIQPTFCREMVPNNTFRVQVNSKVTALPMNSYCFGRLALRTYHQFVPMNDLYLHFDNFIANTQVRYSNGTIGIPSKLPYITSKSLIHAILHAGQASDGFTAQAIYKNEITTFMEAEAVINQFFNANVIQSWNYESDVKIDYPDFVFQFKVGNDTYILQVIFGRAQKNLVSILRALGYSWSYDAPHQNVLKLLAYYKAYFDLFAPQREQTWESTTAYGLIQQMQSEQPKEFSQYSSWLSFLTVELVRCYYVLNADYFTASVQNQDNRVSQITTTPAIDDDSFPEGQASVLTSSDGVVINQNVTNGGANALPLVMRMLRWINKNTVLGKNVKNYLISHFGTSGDLVHQETNFIGSSSVDIAIGDMVQQSETGETARTLLGARSGIIEGRDGSPKFEFTSKQFGYWITLCCVVPIQSGYTQGYLEENLHLSRFDFFTPEFDAVGYTPIQRGELLSETEVSTTSDNVETKSFGLLPRYSSYKTNPYSLLNGDFALNSMRNTYDSMMLYRRLTPQTIDEGVIRESPIANIVTTGLRYIGRFESYGNYNRIFFDPDILLDHFQIHQVYNVSSSFCGLPMSKSFDTDSDQNDINVEHV